jgi:hypothetical protein
VFPDVPPSSSRATILGSPGWCEVWGFFYISGFFYMRNPAGDEASKGGRHGHHDTSHHHRCAACSWWRLVRARTLVLMPPIN